MKKLVVIAAIAVLIAIIVKVVMQRSGGTVEVAEAEVEIIET
jgi:preprotein translocase subunit SecG